MLITVQCFSKCDATRGQKAALRSAARKGGREAGSEGVVERKRGKSKDERTTLIEEVAVSSYNC